MQMPNAFHLTPMGLLLAACLHPAPVAQGPSPVHIVAGSPQASPVTGAPLATLAGGVLSEPVTLPMWLVTPAAGQEPDEWEVGVQWMELENGDLYVDQRSVELGVECRRIHAGATQPSACLEAEFFAVSLEPVRPGLVVARSYAEGCAAFQIISWDAEGQHTLLTRSLGCVEGAVEWRADGPDLLLTSNCDLSGEGCPAMSNEPHRSTWRWSESAGIRPR